MIIITGASGSSADGNIGRLELFVTFLPVDISLVMSSICEAKELAGAVITVQIGDR